MIREITTERGLSRRRPQELLREKAAPGGRQRGTSDGWHATQEETGLELLQEYLAQKNGGCEAPAVVRQRVEASLGRGLPALRMHNDPVAAAIVEEVGARTITVGLDILYGHNDLNLSSTHGWHLVAHELMHVAGQPMRFEGGTPLSIGGSNDVMVHAVDVWKQAMKRGVAEAADFKKKHQKTLTGAGLTRSDVAKMLKFRDFNSSVSHPSAAAQRHVGAMSAADLWKNASEADKKRFGTQAAIEGNAKKMASLRMTMSGRLKTDIRGTLGRQAGLDDVSWNAYMKRALAGRSIWVEDKAAWQGVALNRVDGTGAKVTSAVEHGGGLTMGNAGMAKIVRAYLKRNPKGTVQQALTYAVRKHNPGEKGYAADAWRRYVKLYGSK